MKINIKKPQYVYISMYKTYLYISVSTKDNYQNFGTYIENDKIVKKIEKFIKRLKEKK